MRQRGFVMLTVVVGIVLIAAIAMMLATENAMQADLTTRATEALEADYVAQAALQHAVWQNHNNACGGDVNVPSTPLGAHTYSASRAIGCSGSARQSLRGTRPVSRGSG